MILKAWWTQFSVCRKSLPTQIPLSAFRTAPLSTFKWPGTWGEGANNSRREYTSNRPYNIDDCSYYFSRLRTSLACLEKNRGPNGKCIMVVPAVAGKPDSSGNFLLRSVVHLKTEMALRNLLDQVGTLITRQQNSRHDTTTTDKIDDDDKKNEGEAKSVNDTEEEGDSNSDDEGTIRVSVSSHDADDGSKVQEHQDEQDKNEASIVDDAQKGKGAKWAENDTTGEPEYVVLDAQDTAQDTAHDQPRGPRAQSPARGDANNNNNNMAPLGNKNPALTRTAAVYRPAWVGHYRLSFTGEDSDHSSHTHRPPFDFYGPVSHKALMRMASGYITTFPDDFDEWVELSAGTTTIRVRQAKMPFVPRGREGTKTFIEVAEDPNARNLNRVCRFWSKQWRWGWRNDSFIPRFQILVKHSFII